MKRFRLSINHILLLLLVTLITGPPVRGQEPARGQADEFAHLKDQIGQAIAALDSQRAVFAADRDTLAQQMQALRDELELLRLQMPEDRAIASAVAGRAALPNIFNPTVSVFGNFLLRVDDERIVSDEGDVQSDQMNLREIEIDFRSAIDPFADGLLITTFESEVPGEFEVAVEEGYVVIKRLPLSFLDAPPLGLQFKIGRFRSEFGRFNRLHLHDLPQMSYPLALRAFLGEEGHIGNGVSARILLPFFDESSALEFTAQALSTGGTAVAAEGTEDFSYLGNLRWFRQFGDAHALDMSHTLHYAKTDAAGELRAWTYSLDLLYKWQPLAMGQSRSFLFGGQYFHANREYREPPAIHSGLIPDPRILSATPSGFFVFLQAQFSRTSYLGIRYDQTDDVDFENLSGSFGTRLAVLPYLSWYPSEFLRFRFGYERRFSSVPGVRDGNTVLAEVNFVFGAHPPEPFWVNR